MRKILKIVFIVLLVLMGLSFIFGPQISKYFQNKYYKSAYAPVEIDASSIENFPKSHRIKGIPWISYKKSYCQSAALQMIARKNGIKESVGYFNFLMGFTYGAFFRTDMNIFSPYTDPVLGFKEASPYLGLKMKCLTTNDQNLFLNAVRFYISREHPVVIELNAARLWKEKDIIPHTELLIGYDENGFEYFETGRENRFEIQGKGLKIDDQSFIDAVASLSKEFMTPWKFSLIIFEKDKKEENLKKIWLRNGNFLVGNKIGPLTSGSQSIRQFALKVRKTAKVRELKLLEPAIYTRLDNADFLRKHFPRDNDVEKASKLFKKSGNCFENVLNMLKEGSVDKEKAEKISQFLLNASNFEKEIGEIFLKRGK